MSVYSNKLLLFGLVSILAACGTTSRIDHLPHSMDGSRDLVVFFDGTANDEGSHTNIVKLYNLVTLQNNPQISATYIKGVGTGYRVLGMGTGWGIGNDVREAYMYLIENYRGTSDRISIFGFSRGAYASRILSSLLYVAGIPNAKHLNREDKKQLVDAIYAAYKDKYLSIPVRRAAVRAVINEKLKSLPASTSAPINVAFLGLWDTVGALGIPDYRENIDEPNSRYADQLCNIEAAAHAVSLDDNRARIFTPLLLTRKHLFLESCDLGQVDNPGRISEVWFAGAHSDVGGGYQDTDIDGVSLNWMLDQMDDYKIDIVPKNTMVYADYLGETHDPEAGLAGLIYRQRNRNIPCYTATSIDENCNEMRFIHGSTDASSRIKVHQSVLDRLCLKLPKKFESLWFQSEKYQNCLNCNDQNRGFLNEAQHCQTNIQVVQSSRYEKNVQLRLKDLIEEVDGSHANTDQSGLVQ